MSASNRIGRSVGAVVIVSLTTALSTVSTPLLPYAPPVSAQESAVWAPPRSPLEPVSLPEVVVSPMLSSGSQLTDSASQPDDLSPTELVTDDRNVIRCSWPPCPVGFESYGPSNGWFNSGAGDSTYANHAYYTYASDEWLSDSDNNWAIWSTEWLDGLPYYGQWQVFAYMPRVATGRPDTTRARYTIYGTMGQANGLDGDPGITVERDQTQNPGWVSLGCYSFDSGVEQAPWVRLVDYTTDWRGSTGQKTVLFDAIKWVYGCSSSPGGTVTIRAFLYDLPSGAHVKQGNRVSHCFTVSRAAHIRWWWHNPVLGWSLIKEWDYAGGTACTTSDALQEIGPRRTRAEVYEGGRVLAASEAEFFVDSRVPPPNAPTGLQAQGISPSEIKLTWNDVANETTYYVEGTGAGVEVPADTVTFTAKGLTPVTQYQYRVMARNAYGSAASGWVSATTLPDTKPCAYVPGGTIGASQTAFGGQVTNADTGKPVANITMDLAIPNSGDGAPIRKLTTDSQGTYYAIGPATDFSLGSYVVTTKHRFNNYYSSAAGSINITANICNPPHNISLKPKSQIAIVVHGWLGLNLPGTRGSTCEQGLVSYDPAKPDDFFRDLGKTLVDKEYVVFAAHYNSSPQRTDAIQDNSYCLKTQVEEALKEFNKAGTVTSPAQQVTILAHSMGGLVSRAYIESPRGPATTVKRLITFGTPHQGIRDENCDQLLLDWSNIARDCVRYGRVTKCTVDCKHDPGSCALRESAVMAFNNSRKFSKKVHYDLIGGALDAISLENAVAKAMAGYVPRPNDGVIERKSSLALGLPGLPTDARHSVTAGHGGPILTTYFNSAEVTACLKHALGDMSAVCSSFKGDKLASPDGASAASSPSQGDDDDSSRYVGSFGVDLPAGRRDQLSLPLDGSDAYVTVRTRGGRVSTTLVDPKGATITAATIGSIIAGATFDSVDLGDGTLDTITMPVFPVGAWTLRLVETSGQDADVLVAARVSSPLRLVVESPTGASPNETLRIAAALLDGSVPIDGAQLTAWSSGQIAAFSPDGPGRYAAELRMPPEPGLVSIGVSADGRRSDGVAVSRQAGHVVTVRSPQLRLVGAPSLTLVDDDDNRRYDRILVGVSLQVDAPSDYAVHADLRSRSGVVVAQHDLIEQWGVGPVSARLAFDGMDVGWSGLDGPYAVDLTIRETESTIAHLERLPLLRTGWLESSDFEGGPPKRSRVYIPNLER